jgi:hypothetical protein
MDDMESRVRRNLDAGQSRADRDIGLKACNATSRAEAHEILEKLPLGVAGMMEFELIALGPLAPLAMLIGKRPHT